MPLTALSLMKRWASRQTLRPVVPQTRRGTPGAAREWESEEESVVMTEG